MEYSCFCLFFSFHDALIFGPIKLLTFFLDLQLTCGICFEAYPSDKMSAAACGHPFCITCWQGMYL